MSTLERAFNDMGGSAIVATDIMTRLDVKDYDLNDPVRFKRFQDVLSYLKDKDFRFLINKITTAKNVDKLDHVWGYVELSKQKEDKERELAKLGEEISFYE